jgi:hypothetical protein
VATCDRISPGAHTAAPLSTIMTAATNGHVDGSGDEGDDGDDDDRDDDNGAGPFDEGGGDRAAHAPALRQRPETQNS